MLFNSVLFLLFFGWVVLVHYSPLGWKSKKFHLLLASYFFYGSWMPPFVLLLIISTAVGWLVARLMHSQNNIRIRRLLLFVSLAANLGILGWFKYGTLFMDAFAMAAEQIGWSWTAPQFDIILPIGISFYTFQTLAYTIDVYLKRIKPEDSILDFALFVSFFPQLVAGPIVRPGQLLPQFKSPQKATRQQFFWGAMLFTWGLFQKSVLADLILGPSAGHAFGMQEEIYMFDAWLAVFAFSGQIFFDFAGYSLCAIGIALCLGFSIPNNFKCPYAAMGFSDFWRRWHVSLSEWLRDYLYIPLGGNRQGKTRTKINLMLTMLLGGLWHGANWRFVAWGGIHGAYLLVERAISGRTEFRATRDLGFIQRFVGTSATYVAICITWVFFAAPTWESCGLIFCSLVGLTESPIAVLKTVEILMIVPVVLGMLVFQWLMRDQEMESVVEKSPTWLVYSVFFLILVSVVLTGGGDSAFIYFQF